ncbi:MAG TPA: thymidine kinase [Saprospiraceae bacterium]|nr:thymidine kinase [Saprospiraceae bacterium]
MFLEPHYKGQRSGWIEVVCGAMFSGKTEELIRRLKRATFAHQKVAIFKPSIDIRYADTEVVSHDKNALLAIPVDKSSEILKQVGEATVVGIDEAQFFDDELVDVVQKLALDGKRVVVAGLDMDFRGKPFGPIPSLLAVAEYITKVHPICVHCGNLATHSYRLSAEKSKVLLGEKDSYEPRCRNCFNMGNIMDFHQNE